MGEKVKKQSAEKKPVRKQRLIYLLLSLLLILGSVIIYLLQARDTETAFEYEDNVTVGFMPGTDRDALLAMLQENTDKSMIAFSINAKPTVIGKEMNLFFENPEGNGKDILLTIYENETNEVIYQSKAIREGSYIAVVDVLKAYPPGAYEATAQIIALDVTTHEPIGETAAGLTLQVREP